jgi:hypothetical protein
MFIYPLTSFEFKLFLATNSFCTGRNPIVTNKDFEIWLHFNNIIKHCTADSMTVFNSITLIVRYLIYDFKGIICGIDVFSILDV